MVQISKEELDMGTEFEIGGPDTTTNDHGRLILRKSTSGYEVHDLNSGRHVDSDQSLESLLSRSDKYTTMEIYAFD